MQAKKKSSTEARIFKINAANLLKVKTIVTLSFVLTMVIAVLRGIDLPDEFKMLTSSVVTYYFSKQDSARTPNRNEKEESK